MRRQLVGMLVLCGLLVAPVWAQNGEQERENEEWCITPEINIEIADLLSQADFENLIADAIAIQDSGDLTWTDDGRARLTRRAWLGVYLEPLSAERAKELNVDGAKGALVSRVVKNSPAERAGIQKDDVIVSVDGQAVESSEGLRRSLRDREAGKPIAIEVIRDGRRTSLTATLEKGLGGLMRIDPEFMKIDPNFKWDPKAHGEFFGRLEGLKGGRFELGPWNNGVFFGRRARLGVSVLPLTDQLREHFGVEEGKGVLVSGVSTGSPAERAGIRAGDVIVSVDGDEVNQPGAIVSALNKGGEGSRSVEVRVIRNRQLQILSATIEAPPTGNEE